MFLVHSKYFTLKDALALEELYVHVLYVSIGALIN